jgi:hypothetical protein
MMYLRLKKIIRPAVFSSILFTSISSASSESSKDNTTRQSESLTLVEIESRTNIKFPLRRRRNEIDTSVHSKDDLLLLNCAARCMLNWCSLPIARAYAYAFYIEPSILSELKETENNGMNGGENKLETLLNMKMNINKSFGDITLSLIMARDIPGAHMARGFQNSISNQLARNKTIRNGNENEFSNLTRTEALASGRAAALSSKVTKEEIKSVIEPTSSASPPPPPPPPSSSISTLKTKVEVFSKSFEKIEDLKIGDEVSFTWKANGDVITRINGKPLIRDNDATIKDVVIARALFDVYLGKHSVSKEGQGFISKSLDWMVKNNSIVMNKEDSSSKSNVTRVGTREDIQFFQAFVNHTVRNSPLFPLLPTSLTERMKKNEDLKTKTSTGLIINEKEHVIGVKKGKE